MCIHAPLDDLDRERGEGPEPVYDLARFGDDHDALRRLRDHLLPQQSPTHPLDQVELGRHLVGTVDGQVHRGAVPESDELDADLFRP